MKPRSVCKTCPQRRVYTGTHAECPVCRKWVGKWRRPYMEAGCPDEGPRQPAKEADQPTGPCAACGINTKIDREQRTCSFCRGTNRVPARAPRNTGKRDRHRRMGGYNAGSRRHGDGNSRWSGQGKG